MPSAAPANIGPEVDTESAARRALRGRLLADRERFAALPEAAAAQTALATHLSRLIREIEPTQLGIYWPIRGEFNPIVALEAAGLAKVPLALPYARRQPPEMHYRAWDGRAPDEVDECGLPTPGAGPEVTPDVVLVPCVGFTAAGFRLGFGGGYFDRWMAVHPQATAVGVAWSFGEIGDAAFAARPHDRPLMLVLTERGVAG